jgi:hypothetical protein
MAADHALLADGHAYIMYDECEFFKLPGRALIIFKMLLL